MLTWFGASHVGFAGCSFSGGPHVNRVSSTLGDERVPPSLPFLSMDNHFHHGSWQVWYDMGVSIFWPHPVPTHGQKPTSILVHGRCLHPTVPHPSWYGVDEIWASSIPFGRHRNTILIVVRCRVFVSHSSPTTRLRGRYATRWVFKIDALVWVSFWRAFKSQVKGWFKPNMSI